MKKGEPNMNRKFYDENTDSILTLDEVKELFEEFHEPEETFADFLRNATDKNGSLTEVYYFHANILVNGELESIAGYGATAEDMVKRYAVNHDMEEYPKIIGSCRWDLP